MPAQYIQHVLPTPLRPLLQIGILAVLGACSSASTTSAPQLGSAQTRPAVPVEAIGAEAASDTSNSKPAINAVSFAGGSAFTCVLVEGRVACWGENNYGQLGWGARSGPWVVGLNDALSISLGEYHACAITSNFGVSCWGRNDNGQAGTSRARETITTPVTVKGLEGHRIVELSAATAHTCVRTTEDKVLCWGNNDWAQLAQEDKFAEETPTEIAGLCPATQLGSSGLSQCALCNAGEVVCWGDQSMGQLGDHVITKKENRYARRANPEPVIGLADVVELASSGYSGCGRKAEGTVWCWGWNLRGALGNPGPEIQPAITQVPGLADATKLWSTGEGYCVERRGGQAWCWGGDKLSDRVMHRDPRFEGGTPFETSTSLHSCIRSENAELRCWGSNREGELGIGNKQNQKNPQRVSVLGSAAKIPAMRFKNAVSIGVTQDGKDVAGKAGRVRLAPRPFTLRIRFHQGDSLYVRVAQSPAGSWTAKQGTGFGEADRNPDQDLIIDDEGQHYWFFTNPTSHRFDSCKEEGEWLLCERTVKAMYESEDVSRSVKTLSGTSLYFRFASEQRYGDPVDLRLDFK
ncbi:MAG: hypothetical protein JKY56_09560 [Kofleriaceae bacterium]|nr:hypothetical protein [Kofleriaceae bacterium]